MARTKKSKNTIDTKEKTASVTSTSDSITIQQDNELPSVNEMNETNVSITENGDMDLENELNGEMEQKNKQQNEENESDQENENEEDTPSKKKTKKKTVSYPEEIISDEKYALFLKLYRDRENVEKLVAETVKALKKQKNTWCVQLFALIFYLSDLKINSDVKLNVSISSLKVSEMIDDSQENHFLPFASYSKRSKSTFSYSLPFRRVFSFWVGLGRNLFEFREETSHALIDLLTELTTYNHRNLRFVATSCMLGLMQGLGEVEKESFDITQQGKKKKSVYEQLVNQCAEVRQQLYDQILCHRIRDVYVAIRTLVLVTLASFAETLPSIYNKDDYIKYIGLSLGDSDPSVRLEAVRCLIALTDNHYNEDVRDVLRRYKQRILFMSRDQQAIVIIAIIRLIDLMKEKGLMVEEEDDLVYELAVDADRAIANRAFDYLSKYNFNQPLSKKDKKTGMPEKSMILMRVLQFLEKYAADENETNHVYFFVKNCAGSVKEIITEENKNVLNVEEMVHLLNNQKNSYGLSTRQLSLLSVLLKATVQLFYENHDEDVQSLSYTQYTSVNEAVVPQLENLLQTYKTDASIETHLINMIEYLTFPSMKVVDSIASILMELFKKEQDSIQANHILFILSHLNVQLKDKESVPIHDLLHTASEEALTLWSSYYKEISSKMLLMSDEENVKDIEESCRSLCMILNRLINLLCYTNECAIYQEKGLFTDIELLLMDIKPTYTHPVMVEIRCLCKRLKQLRILYQYYALQKPSETLPSDFQLDDVKADTQMFFDGVEADLEILLPYAETHPQSIHPVLISYLSCMCDLLVVADDSLITETRTQHLGDLARVLLIGYHDQDLSTNEESYSSVMQQKVTKQVLTPLYQVSLANSNTVFPSCLFFFMTDYGALSAELCKDFFRVCKETNLKLVYRIILDSLQYAFSSYKLGKQITVDPETNQSVQYKHLINLSKKFASFLGIQLSYDSLVALFDMIKDAIQFVTTSNTASVIEFFETLIPFASKLTKEAKDLLAEELVKSIEQYDEEVKEVLKNVTTKEQGEEEPKFATVFRLFLMALRKEKGKKTEGKKETEKEELKAIAPKSRKRNQVEKKSSAEPKSKKTKKTAKN